ncbi:MAG: hypothetical protein ACE5E1_06420 [Phycisphaerae bacterium]
MTATVLHISGPAGSGKTTLAGMLAARMSAAEVHHVRFHLLEDHRPPPLRVAVPLEEVATSTRHFVDPRRVFEDVADVIRTAADGREDAVLLVETDAEPCFRHAYPYHVKVFIVPSPAALETVFRSPREAAVAIERAMDDTAEFAAEFFGLGPDPSDSGMLPPIQPQATSRPAATQSVEEFIRSDVGTEITTRMQLQPEYHPIIESDVILLNTGRAHPSRWTSLCARNIEVLLETMRRRLGRRYWFAACDLADDRDPQVARSLEWVEALLDAARITAS